MAIIYSPNKQYSGLSASVSFVNGVGEASDPHLLQWFKEHGYTVEDDKEDGKSIEDMTIPELKEYAALNNIDLGDATKKDVIIAAIKEAGAAGGTVPSET